MSLLVDIGEKDMSGEEDIFGDVLGRWGEYCSGDSSDIEDDSSRLLEWNCIASKLLAQSGR